MSGVRPLLIALLVGAAPASAPRVVMAAPAVTPVPQTQVQPRPPPVRAAALPQGTSLAASALLRWVDGPPDPNAIDRSVASALARVPGAPEIAARIASRLRSLPAPRRQAAFGAREAHLTRAVTAADFASLASSSLPEVGRAEVGPGASSSAPPAGPYELRLSGLASRKVADADGADEPVVVTGAIVASGKKLSLQGFRRFPSSGVGSVVAGANVPTDVSVYTGADAIILVSALLEDNGGDAEPRKAEIHLLTELAIGLVSGDGADGPEALAKLQTRLPESFALLRVHEEAAWGDRTVSSRFIRGSEWTSLVRARKTAGKITYALESRHDTDGGDYSLYFDVSGARPMKKPR